MRSLSWLLSCCLALSLPAQDAGARLHGLVLDEKEQPLADVAVCPFASQGSWLVADLARNAPVRTGKDGRFELTWDWRKSPELDTAMFIAEGRVHVAATLGYLELMPVTLPRARTLAGTVRDAAGKPLAGVRVEARDWLACCRFLAGRPGGPWCTSPEPRTAVRTDASGHFILNGTCETGIALQIGGGGFTLREYGPLAAWQSLDAVVMPAPVVTVEVVDASGRPALGVRMSCSKRPTFDDQIGESGRSDEQGRWQFTWQGQHVQVSASDGGYGDLGSLELNAPAARVRLQLAEPQAPVSEVLAPIPPGSVAVRGKVVDPTSGKPVVGAKVAAVSPQAAAEVDTFVLDGAAGFGGGSEPKTVTVSGTDGAFTLHLAPGRYCLGAAEKDTAPPYRNTGWYRNPTPLPIEVAAGTEPPAVELKLQPLLTVRGSTKLTAAPPGAQVRFLTHRPRWWSTAEAYDWSVRFPVAADGTFTANSVLARAYDLQLLAPRLFRQGMPDKILIQVVDLARGGALEVDARVALPAIVQGTVQGPVPPERLGVVSVAPNQGEGYLGYACYDGPVCPVGRDAKFVLREPPGERVLLAFDLWSGVVLYRGEQVSVAAGTGRKVELDVTAVPLEVRCEGLPQDDAGWLDIGVAEKFWPKGLSQMVGFSPSSNPSGSLGVPVQTDSGTVQLWLPPGPTHLWLRSQRGVRADGKDVIGEAAADPSQPDQQQVTVKPR